MEPPSSDAEALRREETAPVRASYRLLVAADELRHLEGRHQPVWQSTVLRCSVGGDSLIDVSMLRVHVGVLSHRFLPHSGAVSIDADRWSEAEPVSSAET